MAVFITATGTDQGKTYVTRLLCRQHPGLMAVKPVVSGYTPSSQADPELILAAGSAAKTVEQCSPWRFTAPISPDMAAIQENRSIDYSALLEFCRQPAVQLIEGAGGVMSPLTPHHTNLDLILDTGAQVVLVSSLYLGCISHILTALNALAQRQVQVRALVLTPATDANLDAATVTASLSPHLPSRLPLITLHRGEDFEQDWKTQPDLASVVLAK